MAKMTIDNKLGVNRFNVDEENCHIQVDKQHADHDVVNRVVRICPAGLYKEDDEGVPDNLRLRATTASQRDVHIVPEPGCQ